MQIPSMGIRQLRDGEQVRADEVEISASQARRIEQLLEESRRDRAAELAARPGRSKGAKRRRARA